MHSLYVACLALSNFWDWRQTHTTHYSYILHCCCCWIRVGSSTRRSILYTVLYTHLPFTTLWKELEKDFIYVFVVYFLLSRDFPSLRPFSYFLLRVLFPSLSLSMCLLQSIQHSSVEWFVGLWSAFLYFISELYRNNSSSWG